MARIAGVTISDVNLDEALLRIRSLLGSGTRHVVVTANPEILVTAYRNSEYQAVLQTAGLVMADGAGIVLASYFTGERLSKGRVIGVDLAESVMAGKAGAEYTVFLLGGSVDTLQKATHNIGLRYGKNNIVGYEAAPVFDDVAELESNQEHIELINKINHAHPDILLVGFGHPKQELWLDKYLSQTTARLGIGVGGSFDYISGTVKRASPLMRKLGLEWMVRLFNQPKRYKRIFNALIVFPGLFIKERIIQMFHVEH